RELIDLAAAEGIDHCVDLYPYYGSDVSQALRAGYDIRGALIGPGVDASHSFERTHRDALRETARLLLAWIRTAS
ncbi:MAG: peptidase M42, partial [Chloroflexota bacterium]|nr:peptidase M42 [Chloroflexota bacterium]